MANCSGRTLEAYAANLGRFQRNVAFNSTEEATPLAVQSYLSGLREQIKPVSVHQHFRTLKAFFGCRFGNATRGGESWPECGVATSRGWDLKDPKERKDWKTWALRSFHEVRTPQELDAWEERYARKEKAGRPSP